MIAFAMKVIIISGFYKGCSGKVTDFKQGMTIGIKYEVEIKDCRGEYAGFKWFVPRELKETK